MISDDYIKKRFPWAKYRAVNPNGDLVIFEYEPVMAYNKNKKKCEWRIPFQGGQFKIIQKDMFDWTTTLTFFNEDKDNVNI